MYIYIADTSYPTDHKPRKLNAVTTTYVAICRSQFTHLKSVRILYSSRHAWYIHRTAVHLNEKQFPLVYDRHHTKASDKMDSMWLQIERFLPQRSNEARDSPRYDNILPVIVQLVPQQYDVLYLPSPDATSHYY
jgi:hypothetical protein